MIYTLRHLTCIGLRGVGSYCSWHYLVTPNPKLDVHVTSDLHIRTVFSGNDCWHTFLISGITFLGGGVKRSTYHPSNLTWVTGSQKRATSNAFLWCQKVTTPHHKVIHQNWQWSKKRPTTNVLLWCQKVTTPIIRSSIKINIPNIPERQEVGVMSLFSHVFGLVGESTSLLLTNRHLEEETPIVECVVVQCVVWPPCCLPASLTLHM